MSYISKVKLPDNSEFDLNAAKINGHDPAVEISYDDYLELSEQQKNSGVVWCATGAPDDPNATKCIYNAATQTIVWSSGSYYDDTTHEIIII